MPRGVATPKQLAMMARVLDSYSKTYELIASQREDAAELILELFNLGYRDDDAILSELIRRRSPT